MSAELIVAFASTEKVIVFLPSEGVVTRASVEGVVTESAAERVVVCMPQQQVVAVLPSGGRGLRCRGGDLAQRLQASCRGLYRHKENHWHLGLGVDRVPSCREELCMNNAL